MTERFSYQHHPRTEEPAAPVKIADQLPAGSRATRFNASLALKITSWVGTMWCAYAFAILDSFALPEALKHGLYGIVQWVASFFLQLVLLSVIMVAQNMQSAAADKRSEQTLKDAEAILHEICQMQAHMEDQDQKLEAIMGRQEFQG